MLFVTLFAETKFCSIILMLNLEHLAMLNDEQNGKIWSQRDQKNGEIVIQIASSHKQRDG